MKKRLFLHIGSHKTATTFLQRSFAASPATLAALGVIYPAAGRVHGGHFKLVWALKDPAFAGHALPDLPIWAEVMAEIDAAPHQTALLSAESLGWGLDPARLEYLASRYDVQVIFYLRSPDSHLESFYNQIVKDFGTREGRTLDHYMAEEPLGILDTSRLLAPWAGMFGPAAIKLRLFGKSYLPGGIMIDFLSTMGFSSAPEFAAVPDAGLHKISLPPDALEYLRLSNPWLAEAKGHYEFVMRLAEVTRANPDAFQETRSGLLSHKARATLRARFRASQLQAVQAYLGPGRSPFPPSEAPDFPGYETRLAVADARIMGKVAGLLRSVA